MQDRCISFPYHTQFLLLSKQQSFPAKILIVHNNLGLPQYFSWFVFKYLSSAQMPLPLLLLPPSPADCRFYHIWSFTAPCLTAFQAYFLPSFPLAASCSFSTHLNSGIGQKMWSGQDVRIWLSDVSVKKSQPILNYHA